MSNAFRCRGYHIPGINYVEKQKIGICYEITAKRSEKRINDPKNIDIAPIF